MEAVGTAVGDEMREELEESDEIPQVRLRVADRPPSRAAVEQHNRLHMPYRSWCPVCVAAKAVDMKHGGKVHADEDLSARSEMVLDYCFFREVAGGPSVTTLVGRDRRAGLYLAHVVPFKGSAPEWLAAQLVRDIKKAGYFGLLTLKSDQEPAIRDVLAEVAKSRGRPGPS